MGLSGELECRFRYGRRCTPGDNADIFREPHDFITVSKESFDVHLSAALGTNQGSSGAGEPPPDALTEPYVNLSAHTALVIQPLDEHIPSEQTT